MLMPLYDLAGMYALRERRQHVTQEDFEMSVAKVGHARPPRSLSFECEVPSTLARTNKLTLSDPSIGAAQDWGWLDFEFEAVQLGWR